jgi:hypothetical protein
MVAENQTGQEATPKASPPQLARTKKTSMLLYTFIALAAVVAVFLIVVAMQPDDFRVTRSTLISAPAPAVFEQVDDFHNWEAWNPWGKIDPAMEQTYEGAPAGVGAIYSWIGNAQVGEGRMTITDSRPSDLIRLKLEFMKPFAATNTAEFTFKPEGEQTVVTWSMTGKKNFVTKGIGLFMSMDKMIGDQFDKGLADMKSVVDAQPQGERGAGTDR